MAGTYFESTENEYTSDIVGLAWVTFDSTSGVKGSATPRIFVGTYFKPPILLKSNSLSGVVDKGQSVFKSEDGGATC